MSKYISSLKKMFKFESVSLVHFIMGLLMFGASVVQIDDPANKCDPAVEYPTIVVFACTIIGLTTFLLSPLKDWFIMRNFLSGCSFFMSIYVILDIRERVLMEANGVWIVATFIFSFLFIRSYFDLYTHKKEY
jgi:hypothetical protein